MTLTKKFEEIRNKEKSFRKLSFLLESMGAGGLATAYCGLLAEPERTPYIIIGSFAIFAVCAVSSIHASRYSRYLRSEYKDAFGQKDDNH